MKEIIHNRTLYKQLKQFISLYGAEELNRILNEYMKKDQDYILITKDMTMRIKLSEIYYFTICKHTITIHTQNGCFQKYGSLCSELASLSHMGFIKCRQNCIVSVQCIRSVHSSSLTLINGERLPISRRQYASVLDAYCRSCI